MNALYNKYRAFFIFTAAEVLGLLISRPTQISSFFMAWVILSIVLLVMNMLKKQSPPNTTMRTDAGVTVEKNTIKSEKTPQQKRDEAPSLYIQAITGNNRVYTLYALFNIAAYLVCIALQL